MSKRNHNTWISVTLGDLCEEPGGLQTGPFGSQLHASDYHEQGVPVIMPKDIVRNQILEMTIARIPESKADQLKRHRCAVGDIVFARRGEIGRCGLITEREKGWLCGTGCLRFRPSKRVAPSFLIHLLTTAESTQWLISKAVGQTMLNLNTAIIAGIPLKLPTLVEQHKIATILDTWEEAQRMLETLLAMKSLLQRCLNQQLVTGNRRFPDLVQDKTVRQTRYGAVPSDWDYVPIGDIAHECLDKNTDGKKLPVLSCTKHEGLVDSLTYFGRRIFSEDTSTYKIVREGQFAYATNHIEEGSIGYQYQYHEALVSPMYTVFKTDERVDDSFLYKLLKTDLYRHIFEVNTSASVNRRGSLRWSNFAKIKVALPSIEEQRRIVSFLSTCDKEIQLLRQQLDGIERQKQALKQKLLMAQTHVAFTSDESTLTSA